MKVSINGGPPALLSDTNGFMGSWGPNDTIIFSPGAGTGLLQVSASGGTPQPLTALDSENSELSHVSPEILPDGKAFLFTVRSGNGDQIVVQDFETGEHRVLVQDGITARFVSTGHLVYVREGTLLAVPFDLASLEVTGAPVPFIEGVMQGPAVLSGRAVRPGSRHAAFSVSRSGSLVYVPGEAQQGEFQLVWVDRTGAVEPLGAPPRQYRQPALSPDGRSLAVALVGNPYEIWVYDILRTTLTRLTYEGDNRVPLWTPDSERIAFRSTRAGAPGNLYWKRADGSGEAERLGTSDESQTPRAWSSDGSVLAFHTGRVGDDYNLWTLPMDGERQPRPFLQTPFGESEPKFSPDGKWLAYVSDESGRREIYVQPYPGPGGKRQISTDGGNEPVWARGSGELFYRNGNQMMAVEITTEPTFVAGTPRLLFEGTFQQSAGNLAAYDVTPDGQRFVMLQEGGPDSESLTQINVVLNWFEELKERVPTGN